MKSLRKDSLLEMEQVEHTRTEKMVMEHVNHPYLTKLEFAFSTAEKIFFVMQYMRGGELFFHLREARKFEEPQARFYAAQILLGIDHLHQNSIIYRDLKPENVIMDD
jgi:serum/glucocorticoid-regulated kinase 2